MRNELELETRFPLLLAIVAVITAAKLLGSLVIQPWRERRALSPHAEHPRLTAAKHAFTNWFTPFAMGFVAVYPILIMLFVPSGALKWIDNFGIQILIYVMLGWGLNIVVGLAGLLDLGYVAFYAVGAYSYALLAKEFGLSFWILLPLAGFLSAFWGVLLGFPVLRLRGDYLAIVTLAFGEIIRLILINWVSFTGGYAGSAAFRVRPCSAFPSTPATRALRRPSGSNSRPFTACCSFITSSSRSRWSPPT